MAEVLAKALRLTQKAENDLHFARISFNNIMAIFSAQVDEMMRQHDVSFPGHEDARLAAAQVDVAFMFFSHGGARFQKGPAAAPYTVQLQDLPSHCEMLLSPDDYIRQPAIWDPVKACLPAAEQFPDLGERLSQGAANLNTLFIQWCGMPENPLKVLFPEENSLPDGNQSSLNTGVVNGGSSGGVQPSNGLDCLAQVAADPRAAAGTFEGQPSAAPAPSTAVGGSSAGIAVASESNGLLEQPRGLPLPPLLHSPGDTGTTAPLPNAIPQEASLQTEPAGNASTSALKAAAYQKWVENIDRAMQDRKILKNNIEILRDWMSKMQLQMDKVTAELKVNEERYTKVSAYVDEQEKDVHAKLEGISAWKVAQKEAVREKNEDASMLRAAKRKFGEP